MIAVLGAIALVSGLALGGLNELTYEQAANNILRFKKIPAVANLYEIVHGKLDEARIEEVKENLLAEKKYLDLGEGEPVLFFVIQKDGKPFAAALEDFGAGYAGDVGVMVGFELATGNLVGIGITSHSETAGLGSRVTEESFTLQFRDMSKDAVFKVKKDGGEIDAVAGATLSSRAVVQGIEKANAFYQANQERIKEAIEKAN
jgi:electron transport complex protein RnfG